jgi:hypothetical protein
MNLPDLTITALSGLLSDDELCANAAFAMT